MEPIRFGTDGWRGVIAQDFTFANLARVTEGLRLWLFEQTDRPSVMVGYDCRFAGRSFAAAVANQLAQGGVHVFLSPDFVSTPMVSLATLQRQTTAGVVITASHNPPEYSGFKVKGPYGGPAYPSSIARIEALIPDAPPAALPATEVGPDIEYYDMEALYLNHVRGTFDIGELRKSGLRLGYDAMYGAGQRIVRTLLPEAHLLHCAFNPSFMGQAPEPIERNLGPFQELIRAEKLDWGLATDGDADRIGLFDETGAFVDSHHILLLLIRYLHEVIGLSGLVVTTFSCTSKIEALCARYGLPHRVTKIGFKYIGEIMAQENVLVGGEESGGIAVSGHVPERDGVYIGLVVLDYMTRTGKPLTMLVQELYDLVGSFFVERHDLQVSDADKARIMQACAAGYPSIGPYRVERLETTDGFKHHLGAGKWVMIRPSGTEPVLRVYAEGADRREAVAILKHAQGTLGLA